MASRDAIHYDFYVSERMWVTGVGRREHCVCAAAVAYSAGIVVCIVRYVYKLARTYENEASPNVPAQRETERDVVYLSITHKACWYISLTGKSTCRFGTTSQIGANSNRDRKSPYVRLVG
jgi:hypothetical protein